MITKELQDLAWSILPKEFKEEVKKMYNLQLQKPDKHAWVWSCTYEDLFGIHNLTSDAEGEEMLTVSRKKVQGIYKQADSLETCNALDVLFGSKCLPDEELKPAEPEFKVGDKVRILSLHGSPTPDEGVVDVIAHINIGNREHMYYLENHYHCAFGFSESDLEPYIEPTSAFTDDCKSQCKSQNQFRDPAKMVIQPETTEPTFIMLPRLKIAAMAMQGILSNPSPQMVDMPIDRVAQLADAMASILIAECEKGGQS